MKNLLGITHIGAILGCLLLLQFTRLGVAIEGKCSACQAVATELQRRIDEEAHKDSLDFRGRLDGDGNRYGKVIDYKVSELRAVELLDELCESVKKYSLVRTTRKTTGAKDYGWYNLDHITGTVSFEKFSTPNSDQKKTWGRIMESYCGALIGDYEEEVVEAIQDGRFDAHGVKDMLCYTITKQCKTRPSEQDSSQVSVSTISADEEEL